MNYLLDTCVISEFTKPRPNQRLIEWLSAQDEYGLCLSAIVIGELARGIARLTDGPKRRNLDAWLHADLRRRFSGRILPVDEAVALAWGATSGRLQQQGYTLPLADGLIAATAAVHSLVVVTRNTRDLAQTGVPLLNPWDIDPRTGIRVTDNRRDGMASLRQPVQLVRIAQGRCT